MKKQDAVKTVLVKKAVAEAIISETARASAAIALDTLDEHLSGLPLDIVAAARRAFASGKAPLQVIVQGAKNLAAKRRNDILAADRERERELARKQREEKAKREAEEAALAAAAAKDRVKELAEAEEDESVKALLLASLETPTAKKRTKSTSTSNGESKVTLSSRIRALLPCTRAVVHTSIPEVTPTYLNHYLTEYSERKPSKGKSGFKVKKVGSKPDANDYFFI